MKIRVNQIKLSNFSKKIILVSLDILIIIFAVIFSYSVRLDSIYNPFDIDYRVYIIFISVFIFNFYVKNIYQIVISFFNNQSIVKIIYSVLISQIILFIINIMTYKIFFFPRSTSLIAPIICGIFFISIRIILSYLVNLNKNKLNIENKILIFGVNEKSLSILKDIQNYPNYGKVVAFIEVSERYKKREIGGIKIYKKKDLNNLIERYKITEIIINSRSFSKKDVEVLYDKSEKYNFRVKNLNNIKNNNNFLSKSLEIVPNFFEIIGRSKINVENKILIKKIKGKSILVTGGGGSIGSELCIQILKYNPKKLFILDNSEINLFNLSKKLEDHNLNRKKNFRFILGDCCDLNLLKTQLDKVQIDEIYHAAAYKHVGFSEENMYSLLKNNVIGTKVVLEFSLSKKIENFTFISTDKAVNPMSVLGYTKKIGEFLVNYYSKSKICTSKMKFTVVRFGNVIGSSGSVIPLFIQQIKENKPLTVTDKNVRRYFMTISEAVQLVINSSFLNNKKFNIYVLDMGKQIKIYHIARKIVKLCGFAIKDKSNPSGDVSIKIIGLKKGEKLSEEISLGRNLKITKNPKIMLCNENLDKSLKIAKLFKKNLDLGKFNKKSLEKILKFN